MSVLSGFKTYGYCLPIEVFCLLAKASESNRVVSDIHCKIIIAVHRMAIFLSVWKKATATPSAALGFALMIEPVFAFIMLFLLVYSFGYYYQVFYNITLLLCTFLIIHGFRSLERPFCQAEHARSLAHHHTKNARESKSPPERYLCFYLVVTTLSVSAQKHLVQRNVSPESVHGTSNGHIDPASGNLPETFQVPKTSDTSGISHRTSLKFR